MPPLSAVHEFWSGTDLAAGDPEWRVPPRRFPPWARCPTEERRCRDRRPRTPGSEDRRQDIAAVSRRAASATRIRPRSASVTPRKLANRQCGGATVIKLTGRRCCWVGNRLFLFPRRGGPTLAI